MALLKQFIIFAFFLLCTIYVSAYPTPDTRNPNLEYELISGGAQVGPKPSLIPISTTSKPFILNTPPPPDPNSKTFAFDPIAKSWTLVKKNDPKLPEDTFLWNQSNDKWLTNISRV